jgi:hypothetical protein
LESNDNLKVYINKKYKIINVNKNKIIYSSSNNKYDIIIIRLEDNEIEHYLEIDVNIFNKNSEELYKKEPIYIIHYPGKDSIAKISYGEGIEKIDEYDIKHLCNTEEGSSGSPILSAMTHEIIGIHKAVRRNKDKKVLYNIGTFLKFPLNELNDNNNDNYNIKRKTNMKIYINKKAKNFNLEKLEVPDSIFEFLIRFYFLNENLKDKIKKKIDISEKYYIINYEFINNIQKLYNYNQIKKELENFKYLDEKNLDYKISDIIYSIKKKAIIKDIIPLNNIQIIPRIEELYLIRQYVNFCLVNEEIIETIKKIDKDFNLKRPVSQNKHSFYFKPQLFYKGKDYIKIGELKENCYFELHYFIHVDLYKCNFNNLLKEINNSISIKEFFKQKNIDIDAIEMNDLIYLKFII